jgi:hypothetical protein
MRAFLLLRGCATQTAAAGTPRLPRDLPFILCLTRPFKKEESLPMTAVCTTLARTFAPRRTSLRALAALSLAGALWGHNALAQDQPQMNLQRVELTAGVHRIDAQVAATPQERQTGLMHRKEMPQHEATRPAVLLDEEHATAADSGVRGR